MYGYESFDDAFEGYGMLNYSQNPDGSVNYRGMGQRDIMDMVMSDITGMNYGDLARLNTIHVHDRGGRATHGDLSSYTPDQMAQLKEFFVSSNLQSYEAATARAQAEDEYRRKSVEAAKIQALKSGKALEQTSKESLGQSAEQVQLQLRELDEDYMKKLGSFKTSPKKRKVRQVSFTEGRLLRMEISYGWWSNHCRRYERGSIPSNSDGRKSFYGFSRRTPNEAYARTRR